MCISGIAAAGLALSAIGTGVGVYGQMQQTAAMRRAEAAREKQMNLEAARQRRDIARNATAARAIALANATSQGAADGSGLAGGEAQITGRAGQQTLATNQNQELGGQIFAANRDYYSASGISSFGSGLSSLGGVVMNNAGTINRVGTYFGIIG